jgi:hypothetical protein
MITEICLYLRNWFDWNQPKYFGKFKIENGILTSYNDEMLIQDNQFYRIVGSVFNDQVHRHGEESLHDEVFEGAVWLMAIPQDVISLAVEIDEWQKKYGALDSQNMSPYQSESFGGYSYSKSGGGSGNSDSSVGTWQAVYADRLKRYKKI